MKASFLIIAVLFSSLCTAAEKMDLAKQMIEESGILAKWEVTLPKIRDQFITETKRDYAVDAPTEAEMRRRIDVTLVKESYAEVVCKLLSEDEIIKITEFYKSPAAKKLQKIELGAGTEVKDALMANLVILRSDVFIESQEKKEKAKGAAAPAVP
ncbi:MAG: DUF2059 domain-containing protein [Planctomycetes bacterium]|nr:DUF2059 domain-containing protein [Planctomycetota bacterium]